MKVVVIGGTGQIGARVVANLRAAGHEAIAASPRHGVDAVTGTGLAEALAGAAAVVDVSNAPTQDLGAARAFFRDSATNLVREGRRAGVRHHVVLSIVGADLLPGNPYMAAKVTQEQIVAAGEVPYTVVRATQFFEFLPVIADGYTAEGVVRLPDTLFQPVAADDVGRVLAETATREAAHATLDLAGPDRAPMAEFARRYLAATGDDRRVEIDPGATYFGAAPGTAALVPAGHAELGRQPFDDWLRAVATAAPRG